MNSLFISIFFQYGPGSVMVFCTFSQYIGADFGVDSKGKSDLTGNSRYFSSVCVSEADFTVNSLERGTIPQSICFIKTIKTFFFFKSQ